MASGTTLHFDRDLQPDDILKAFNEFMKSLAWILDLGYEAQNPDPPKVSIDAAIEPWKLANKEAKPTLEQYNTIGRKGDQKTALQNFLACFLPCRLASFRTGRNKTNRCDMGAFLYPNPSLL